MFGLERGESSGASSKLLLAASIGSPWCQGMANVSGFNIFAKLLGKRSRDENLMGGLDRKCDFRFLTIIARDFELSKQLLLAWE